MGNVYGQRGETSGVVYFLLVKRAALGWFAQSVGRRGEKARCDGVMVCMHMNEMGRNALKFDLRRWQIYTQQQYCV